MGLFDNFEKCDHSVIVQTLSDGNLKAFTHLDGKNLKESGDAAKQLITKIKTSGGKVIEASDNHLIIDRGFDLQAHLRFPGQDHKETLEGGLRSAFEGGYDSLIAMPNTSPFLDNPNIVRECLEGISKLGFSEIKVGQTAAGTENLKGQKATNIAALKEAGAVAITDDGWGVDSAEAMEDVFRQCADQDLVFMQHAERPGHGGYAPKSAFQTKHNIPEYPSDAESWMVKRDVELLEKVPNARYHVLHVTTALSVEAIKKAKDKGLNVTAEVSPHHLYFCNEEIPDEGNEFSTYYKMNPPLFSAKDREALRQGLRDGVLDCLSTDHAPHTAEEKKNSWVKAPFGTRGLETALSALSTLCSQGIFSYDKIEDYFSTVPRRILQGKGFDSPQGFVIFDKEQSWKVSRADLPGISGNSIFLGHTLKGKIAKILTPNGLYS